MRMNTFLLAQGLSWILVGDHNMTPEEFVTIPCVHKCDVVVIVADSGAATCNTDRCLDYIWASSNIARCISDVELASSPW